MTTNLEFLSGKDESTLCVCEECGRLFGSHQLVPVEAITIDTIRDANAPKIMGACPICKAYCVPK